jgi:hypothetical protein
MGELEYKLTHKRITNELEHESNSSPLTKRVSLYGWDGSNKQSLAVDASGNVKIDHTNLDDLYGYTKLVFGIGNGTDTVTTGEKSSLAIPFDCAITGWTIFSDDASITSGTIVIDVWKNIYGNYPPTSSNTIVSAGNKPTISAGIKGTDITTSWLTTAITKDDILRFNVVSAATVTKTVLVITVKRM